MATSPSLSPSPSGYTAPYSASPSKRISPRGAQRAELSPPDTRTSLTSLPLGGSAPLPPWLRAAQGGKLLAARRLSTENDVAQWAVSSKVVGSRQ